MSLTFLQKGDQKCDQNTDEKEELGIKYTKEKHYMLLIALRATFTSRIPKHFPILSKLLCSVIM